MFTQLKRSSEKHEGDLFDQECVLRASGISKKINDSFMVSDLNLELYAGEIHVVLGENGAGKTTLVKLLSGVLIPDSGEISILGRKARIDKPAAACSWGISVAHQELTQFPAMSVAENLYFYLHGAVQAFYASGSAARKAKSILDELGLLPEVDPQETVANLSVGQRRQLQIASAIIQDSPIIILDDPTSYLSDVWRMRFRQIVSNLKMRKKAILYTCHRLDEAKTIADKVTILREGKRAALIEKREELTSANLLMGMIGVLFRTRATPGLPIDDVSSNVESELGYNPRALVSEHRAYESIICPEDRQRAMDSRDELVHQGLSTFEREYRVLCANGHCKWVHDVTRVVRDSNDAIDSYSISIVDIEGTDRAQEVIRQSEQKYESLVRNVPDVVYSSLPDGRGSRIFLSDRWEAWTGQSVHDVYRDGQTWTKAVYNEDLERIRRAYSAACVDRSSYEIEYRLVHKDSGQLRYVRDHGVPIKDRDGRIARFDGLLTDVTKLKNLEIALQQSEKSLRSYANLVTRAQEEERKKIAREIHDETIQLLFGSCAQLDNILGHLKLPSHTRHDIELVSNSFGSVIDSLRSLCREIRPDIIDRFGLVDAVELFLHETEERSGLSCKLEISGHAPNMPNDLQIALFRIVQEAVNNIRKHSQSSQFRLCITFADNSVEIVVEDNGVGFEVPTLIGNFASDGKLGLVGMKERARLIGGNLSVDSQIGRGTVVTLRAPLLGLCGCSSEGVTDSIF
jgi:PAS domain S-box-containing protein